MSQRFVALSALIAAGTLALLPATASATYPGQNGGIAYVLSKYDKRAKYSEFVGQGALFSVNADGSGGLAFPDDELSNDSAPAWSADGTQFAYAALTLGESGIYVGALNAWASKRLIVESDDADMPAFSPDAKTIAYSDYPKGLYTVPADGSAKPTRLLKNAKGWTSLGPTYSPDGSTIFFSRYKTTGSPKQYRSEIWAVDASGANARVVVAADANHRFPDSPDVSPDGTKLVFAASTSEGRPAIWTSALDGTATNVLSVARGTNYLGTPTWSPDGKKIAAVIFKPSIKKGGALVTIDAASGSLTTARKVTKAYITSPSWQPIPAATPAG